MKSVVIDTPGQVRVETVPDPRLPGADGAVVQVRSTAICGSDPVSYTHLTLPTTPYV